MIELCYPRRVDHLTDGVQIKSATPKRMTGERLIVGVPETGYLAPDHLDKPRPDLATWLLDRVEDQEAVVVALSKIAERERRQMSAT